MRRHTFGLLARLFVAVWLAALATHLSAGLARAADTLPGRWDGRNIGNVGVAGGASNSGGGTAGPWTISRAGDDIWGTADAFHYRDGFVGLAVTSHNPGALTTVVFRAPTIE